MMMGKTIKMVLTISLCFAFILTAAAGCGTNNAAPGDTTAPVASTGGMESKDPVKLVYWNVPDCFKTSDDTGRFTKDELIMNVALKEFQDANPNIKIELVDQTYDNIPNLFKAAGLAKNGPDISLMWAGSFTDDFKEFIQPLDDYLTPEELAQFPDLLLCRTGFKTDGELLAIPTESTTLNIYYNKELFGKAGVDENYAPATWDEFIELCKKLKAGGVAPIIIGDKEGWTSAWAMGEFLTDLYGTADIFKLKTGEAKATDESFKKAMQTWTDFFKLGLANEDYYSLGNSDAANRFIAGEAAMRIGGSWDTASIVEALGDNAGTFMLPSIAKDAPYADYLCSQFSNNLVVTNYSKHPEEAVKFIKYITSADFQIRRFSQDGQLPSRLDADITKETVNPLAVTSFSWIQRNKNVTGFDSIYPADACQEFYRLAPVVISGKMTVDEMVKTLQEKADAVINK